MLVAGALSTLVVANVSYENSPTPYAVELPPAPPTPPISERVVLLVSDGLRYDMSLQLPTISALSRRGDAAMFRAQTQVPSLSLPGWTALGTGAGPTVSGVRTNGYKASPVPVESLFQTASRVGMKTALAGGATEWDQLFAGQPSETYVEPSPDSHDVEGDRGSDPLIRNALAGPAGFALVYYPAVDEVSHAYGATSDEAARTMLALDQRVSAIARQMDLSRQTLIVTSDHGHMDRGGHGGYEDLSRGSTLLMVGKGIHPSPVREVSQLDVAPTVAALLGIPRPRDGEGMPVISAIDAESGVKSRIETVHNASLRARLRADYSVIGRRAAPDASVEVLKEQIASVSWTRATGEILIRLPVGILVVGLFALALMLAGGLDSRSVGAAAIYVGIVVFGVAMTGFTLSISWMSTPQDTITLYGTLIGSTILALALGGAIVGFGRPGRAWREALRFTTVGALVISVSACSLMVYYGPITSWRLPDLRFAIALFFLPVVSLVVATVALPITAGMAALGGKLGSTGSIRTGDASAKGSSERIESESEASESADNLDASDDDGDADSGSEKNAQ